MTELFEVITKEEFEESGVDDRRNGETDSNRPTAVRNGSPDSAPDTKLTYCEFCKGYYNEYHFGDIDEPSR